MEKEKLFGKTLSELSIVVKDLGLPAFTAKQLADWLYKKNIQSIDEMTNLSKAAREKLNSNYQFGLEAYIKVQESVDGTKKYLFPTLEEKFIETAMIPDADRKTVCVSSQVGCKMGCLFCMTGKQGFQGHLSTADILNQYRNIPEWPEVTNLVYMGMGEPFDNIDNVLKSLDILTAEWGFALSPKRITVSSIGLLPGLQRFLTESKCHLAISLHNPFDEERRQLMPIQNVFPIVEVLKEIRKHDFTGQRRVSFEYIMFDQINDQPRHARELIRLLANLNCRINLIRFHPIPGTPLNSSSEQVINEFKEALNARGITTTVRSSRGKDIFAACGLLSTKELLKKQRGEEEE